ncbi:hypothetical protein GGS20DRAFT_530065 [Poronia punctata]|nr:hypothetical protein GGS20DRAFT_530065 [Poronia punctata]
MPFPYKYICDLLQNLEDETRKPSAKQTPSRLIIKAWFQEHRALFNAPDSDPSAIISTLLPERRTDRVYGIQAPRLQGIFGKALLLGTSRVSELRRWTEPGSGVDLGDCIESVVSRTPITRGDTSQITVEEIDEAFSRIAACCRFSSPAVRALRSKTEVTDPNGLLGSIYRRLGSRDAKWFTRLVLKNYQPITLNANVIFRQYHPLLPQMMNIRDDLAVSTALVRHIDKDSHDPATLASILKPRLGTKVGRQPWYKGRSIRHCLDMINSREFACEQKLDGEYCQIHIDLRKNQNRIQIFSKSGKDSTTDRVNVHKAIRESLKLGTKDCPIKTGCILEGELLVYSTKENKILPFHKIRKHVNRSGSFIGTMKDSQAHEHERLMMVYFDLLMIDDESLLGTKNSERFRRLREIVTCREGVADLVTRTSVPATQSAAPALRELFAQCITSHREGLVLKPDVPYFEFDTRVERQRCFNVKLKKEYIQGWGDVGDFTVVGASYDAAKAREYRIRNVEWTHFFIGCLENKDQARAKTEKPRFRVTNIVELTGPVLAAFWGQHRLFTVPYEENTIFEVDCGTVAWARKPTVIFPQPLVFDMRCFNFDREPNTDFWSMRFPQVSKVHHDRSYLDTVSFSELQGIAEASSNTSDEVDSQEMRYWVQALERLDRDEPSQATTCSDIPPPSPSSVSSESSESPTASSPTVAKRIRRDFRSPTKPPTIGLIGKSTSFSVSTTRRSKRSSPAQLSAPKRQCTHSSLSSPAMSKLPVQPELPPAPKWTEPREPLSQVDINGSQQHTDTQANKISLQSTQQVQGDTEPHIENQPVPSSPILSDTGSGTASETDGSPIKISRPGRKTVTAQRQVNVHNKTNTQGCSLAGHECFLANYSILLAPCISSYAWITDNLLGQHGIADTLLDPRVWNIPEPSTTGDGPTLRRSPRKAASTVRKICLVESRRKEATQAFLQKIKDAGLKKKGGGREWVAVYDWKVLEAITEQEERGKSARVADPWRRFYVGIV